MTVKNPTPLHRANKTKVNMVGNFFQGRTAVLASMHGKEKVIAPLLEAELGICVIIATGIDTDQFGTFTGDVPRTESAYQTALRKIEAARKRFPDQTLFVASEGSFNPHPDAPILTVNSEIVVLVDDLNDIEIAGTHHSMETTAERQVIRTPEDAIAFAVNKDLERNALVAKTYTGSRPIFLKGIRSIPALRRIMRHFFSVSTTGEVELETDLRAFCNEQRMANIGKATEHLLRKLNTPCPSCGWPGFEITETQYGLPCSQCHMPTKLAKSHLFSCKKCGCTVGKGNTHNLLFADPMHCDHCNP